MLSSPLPTVYATSPNTVGEVCVACFAAKVATVGGASFTSGWRATNSAASLGNRSSRQLTAQ